MISVCMASFNGARYIGEQVASILSQLGEGDELIVSDDGSTDGTCDVVRAFGDARVRLVVNEGRHGVVGNFENALCKARGEIVFLSDQDDVWLAGHVSECVEALGRVDLVVTDCVVTDGELRVVSPSFFELRGSSGAGFWRNLVRNSYLGATMAFRRSLLEVALPFPSRLPGFHDMWLGSLAALTGRVGFLDHKGILYRRHESTASFTAGRSGYSLWEKLRYRAAFLMLIAGRMARR